MYFGNGYALNTAPMTTSTLELCGDHHDAFATIYETTFESGPVAMNSQAVAAPAIANLGVELVYGDTRYAPIAVVSLDSPSQAPRTRLICKNKLVERQTQPDRS